MVLVLLQEVTQLSELEQLQTQQRQAEQLHLLVVVKGEMLTGPDIREVLEVDLVGLVEDRQLLRVLQRLGKETLGEPIFRMLQTVLLAAAAARVLLELTLQTESPVMAALD